MDRNEKQCESAVFFVKQFEFIMKNKKKSRNLGSRISKKECVRMARIDHAAIRTKLYEEAQHFF